LEGVVVVVVMAVVAKVHMMTSQSCPWRLLTSWWHILGCLALSSARKIWDDNANTAHGASVNVNADANVNANIRNNGNMHVDADVKVVNVHTHTSQRHRHANVHTFTDGHA
jgi:hypothetical protein